METFPHRVRAIQTSAVSWAQQPCSVPWASKKMTQGLSTCVPAQIIVLLGRSFHGLFLLFLLSFFPLFFFFVVAELTCLVICSYHVALANLKLITVLIGLASHSQISSCLLKAEVKGEHHRSESTYSFICDTNMTFPCWI